MPILPHGKFQYKNRFCITLQMMSYLSTNKRKTVQHIVYSLIVMRQINLFRILFIRKEHSENNRKCVVCAETGKNKRIKHFKFDSVIGNVFENAMAHLVNMTSEYKR